MNISIASLLQSLERTTGIRGSQWSPEGRIVCLNLSGGPLSNPIDVELRFWNHLSSQTIGAVGKAHREHRSETPLMHAFPYVNANLASILRDLDIPFLDMAGNIYLRQEPGILLHVTGNRLKHVGPPEETPLFNEGGIRLIYQYLTDDNAFTYPYRTLAERAGISLGSVSQLRSGLEEQGHLFRRDGQDQLMDPAKMMDLWVEAFNRRWKPKHSKSYTAQITFVNMPPGTNLWFGGLRGAKAYGFKAWEDDSGPNYSLESESKMMAMYGCRPDAYGPLRVIRPPFNQSVVFDHERFVHPLIVYADLLMEPDSRVLEMAEALRERHLPTHR